MARSFPVLNGRADMATIEALRGSGWSRAAIRHWVATRGQRPYPGVVVAHRGRLGPHESLVAAALWAGPDSVLTGARALELLGVPVGTPEQLHFLVDSTARGRTCGPARTHRTLRLPRHQLRDGVRLAGADRALVDAGRYAELTATELRAATIAALQQHLSAPPRLAGELTAGPRNGTREIRRGLADFTSGAWSLPEARLAALLRGGRPKLDFLANPRLLSPEGALIGIPDCYLPAFGIVIQVHSHTHHAGTDGTGRDRWEATVEWDSDYTAHGLVVVGVAPTTLQDRPQRFLQRLDRVIAGRGRRSAAVIAVADGADGRSA